MSRLATALCFTASVCLPQSPPTDPFLAWLDRIAQQQLDDRGRAVAAIRTQADARLPTELPGRYPAVPVPSGHTQEGKPETQIVAANLAAKGFIALAYDPIGQGEREQTYLPQLGRVLSGGGGNEHLELGARSILLGQSVARYFIFDAKRAIDYLVSCPDVDSDRIGVTGCSGGGAITIYVGVFEPPVKAAAPG